MALHVKGHFLWRGFAATILSSKQVIKANRHGLNEEIGGFAPSMIERIKEVDGDRQALLRMCTRHQGLDKGKRWENDALTGAGDIGKEPMSGALWAGVVFRAVGGKAGAPMHRPFTTYYPPAELPWRGPAPLSAPT